MRPMLTILALITVSVAAFRSHTPSKSAREVPVVQTPDATSSPQHRFGPPRGKIRVANLYEIDGHPFGPIDVYDTREPKGDHATPLIKGLAFGRVSDYVSPRASDDFDTARSNLFLFPAGSTDATPPLLATHVDNSGFLADDQITVMIGPGKGLNGTTAGWEISNINEAGKRVAYTDVPPVPGGKALLLARAANLGIDAPVMYLQVDGTCRHALNDSDTGNHGGPSGLGSTHTFAFAVDPGQHTLGIVGSPAGHGLNSAMCNGHAASGTTTSTVTAGQRAAVLVYGSSIPGLKLVAAPIAP
jgi:hypothetical protein